MFKKALKMSLVFIFMFSFYIIKVKADEPVMDGEITKVYDLGSASATIINTAGANIYMNIYTEAYGMELWVTTGTEASTRLVKDINEGTTDSYISYSYAVGDILYFYVYVDEYGLELWRTDGTEEGTWLTKDICPGTCGDVEHFLPASINNTLFFMAADGVNGYELWKTNGTEEGTVLVKDINEGSDSTNAYRLINLNGSIYIFANVSGDYHLWKSDGTTAGTVFIKELDGRTNYDSISYLIYNNELYFITRDDDDYRYLWKTDGTTSGTVQIVSSNPEATLFLSIKNLAILNNNLYFFAYSEDINYRLYKLDDQSSFSLVELADFDNMWVSSLYIASDDYIYFLASQNDGPYDMWRTNGTSAGTEVWASSTFFEVVFAFYDMKKIDNNIYILADSFEAVMAGEKAASLIESDGTIDGTLAISDYLAFGEGPFNIYNSGEAIYYFKSNQKNGEYWDGDIDIMKYTPNPSEYTVTFKDYDGTNLKVETVADNGNATAPSNPTRNGYTFTGWDKTFDNVKSNLVVNAQYSKNATVSTIANAADEEEVTIETIEPQLDILKITNSLTLDEKTALKNKIKILWENNQLIDVYDINLLLNGEKIQPEGNIEIRILLTDEQKEYNNLRVIYANDEELTIIPHIMDGDYIVFSVDHLSHYAIIGEKEEINKPINIDYTLDKTGDSSNNSLLIIGGISSFITILLVIILVKKKKSK